MQTNRLPSFPYLFRYCATLAVASFLPTTLMAVTLSELMHPASQPAPTPYIQSGGIDQSLYCFPPADLKPGDKRAAVILIHGGAWIAGSADVFFAHARYFAARGAVAFSINYRLVTASGPSVGDCLADCKSAVRYIRTHASELGVDPEKIAVLGDSAGGHLAAALGTVEGFDAPNDDKKRSGVPNAMILCNPIVDMTEADWPKFIIRGKALDRHATPADKVMTEPQRELARHLSPLFNVRPGQPPALMMHGLNDHVVSPDQARKFAAAMEQAKNRCDLVLIEGAGHAFIIAGYSAPEAMVVDAIRRADKFLISLGWLSGEPTLEVSNPPAWPPRKK